MFGGHIKLLPIQVHYIFLLLWTIVLVPLGFILWSINQRLIIFLLISMLWSKTQFDCVIKQVRSDNGSEFTSQSMKSFLSAWDFTSNLSCSYSSTEWHGWMKASPSISSRWLMLFVFKPDYQSDRFWDEFILMAAFFLLTMYLHHFCKVKPLIKLCSPNHLRTLI